MFLLPHLGYIDEWGKAAASGVSNEVIKWNLKKNKQTQMNVRADGK